MPYEKHEAMLRLRAIELLAYWEGRLVTNRLTAWFGISRQQASSDIKRYNTTNNPDSLIHDPSVKGYVPKAGFQPVLTSGQINEYFELMSGLLNESDAVTLESADHLSAVQLPDRMVRPEVFRAMSRACRSRSSLKIIYASMSSPLLKERVISPHTLIYTGFRWHVRAYCHLREEFRDFILSRIDRIPKPASESSPDPSQDALWHEQVLLTLVPNPRLNEGQKALVEKDFGMPDGRLQISVRKSLAHYTLQRYQAGITADDASNELKFPVILQETDREELSPYLFDSAQ
ncbi:WYL domain-containing protein [Leucothrix mucor]|uniref:WYL domain-containing protein n=1 Tax=Leucothrix mucor TaxID=45248 RepID=UPI0003B40FDB|nr:WYL domain-containing protein [Leucothrix mucor]